MHSQRCEGNHALRKTILYISGLRIFPSTTGSQVRTAGIAAALARLGHRVLVYSLAGRQGDYSMDKGIFAALKAPFRTDPIDTDLSEETNLGLGYGVLQAVGRRLDYPRVWQHRLMARGFIPRRLKAHLRDADIVLCDMAWCPPIPGPWRSKPWLLVSHNLDYRLLEQGTPRQRRFAGWMRGVESAAPTNYQDILACAEEDHDFFQQHDASRQLVLPVVRCGVDPRAYATPPGTRERIRGELGLTDADTLLVFSGSGFGPNVEALAAMRTFAGAEAGFLAHARIHILVLGSVSSTAWRDGAMSATGRVPDVAPYFAAADAGLNPITRGSGANVKLFEYLAARLPVISTKFGVRGTQLQADADFLLLDPEAPRGALERFVTQRTREQWRAHGEEVWLRHRSTCDIDELVRDAIGRLPQFAA
jgi:glycosyltransferase involved in cell wall biosynthesis